MGGMTRLHPECLSDWSQGAQQASSPWRGSVHPCGTRGVCLQALEHSLSVCPGLRDLVATQLSIGRLKGCCTLVRMIL